jgi:hypothetical protein
MYKFQAKKNWNGFFNRLSNQSDIHNYYALTPVRISVLESLNTKQSYHLILSN